MGNQLDYKQSHVVSNVSIYFVSKIISIIGNSLERKIRPRIIIILI